MLQSAGTFIFPPGRLVLPDVCCDVSVVDDRIYFSGAMTTARPTRHVGRRVQLLRIGIASTRDWLRMPVAELTDLVVPLEDIDRRLAFDVERFLERHALPGAAPGGAEPRPDPRFLEAARMLTSGAAVRTAAERVALSERHLERLFHDRVGMAPKPFARIMRFRKSYFAASAGVSLAAAASDGGYADQAHFTRETQRLTGYSPSALLARTGHVGFVQDASRWRDSGCE